MALTVPAIVPGTTEFPDAATMINRGLPVVGTAAEFTTANPVLLLGQVGRESDTKKEKVGDGATAWTSLAYAQASRLDGLAAADKVLIFGPTGELETADYLAASGAASRFWIQDATGVFKLATVAETLALLSTITETLGLGTLQLGHASDTSLTRFAPGILAVEGVPLYPGIPVNDFVAAKTLGAGENNQCWRHPSTDANARTITIPANATVAYPIGSFFTFTNETSQAVTIAITSDTLRQAGTGATGSRTLAQWGEAVAMKKTATSWVISGTGLS